MYTPYIYVYRYLIYVPMYIDAVYSKELGLRAKSKRCTVSTRSI